MTPWRPSVRSRLAAFLVSAAVSAPRFLRRLRPRSHLQEIQDLTVLGNPAYAHGLNHGSVACLLQGNMVGAYGEWHSNNMTVDYALEG
jgi:hypothetical protein